MLLRNTQRGYCSAICDDRRIPSFLRSRLDVVLQSPLLPTLLVGLVKIGLYTYSILVSHVLALLHCVSINGLDGTFLLQAAYVQCYQPWQIFLIFVVVGLFLFPLILGWKLRGTTLGSPSSLTTSALVTVLSGPYVVGYWESVLLFYRLLVVVVATFVNDAVVCLFLLFLINSLMLIVHMHVRPFRDASAQHLQTLCICLLPLFLPGRRESETGQNRTHSR
jgi:hypothetical protein